MIKIKGFLNVKKKKIYFFVVKRKLKQIISDSCIKSVSERLPWLKSVANHNDIVICTVIKIGRIWDCCSNRFRLCSFNKRVKIRISRIKNGRFHLFASMNKMNYSRVSKTLSYAFVKITSMILGRCLKKRELI